MASDNLISMITDVANLSSQARGWISSMEYKSNHTTKVVLQKASDYLSNVAGGLYNISNNNLLINNNFIGKSEFYIRLVTLEALLKKLQEDYNSKDKLTVINDLCVAIEFVLNGIQSISGANSELDSRVINHVERLVTSKLSKIDKNNIKTIEELKEDLTKYSSTITDLEPEISNLKSKLLTIGENTDSIERLITERTFEEQNNVLSRKFFEERNRLQSECKWYLISGITLTSILGIGYIGFFIYQFCHLANINYINHLLLIAVCSPLIFLIAWLFFQVSRITKLIEIYSYKSDLGYTIKETMGYVNTVNAGDTDKQVTLSILNSLLFKLYESPIQHGDYKEDLSKSVGEITKLLKEVRCSITPAD